MCSSASLRIQFVVEWDETKTSWADFRGSGLGPTDPADAPPASLRGQIAASWQSLGLPGPCDVGDNGVHASASPFEAMAERCNWLRSTHSISTDPFGKAAIAAGVPESVLAEWSVDPQVKYNGSMSSLFDLVEDLDSSACIAKLVDIYAPAPAPQENEVDDFEVRAAPTLCSAASAAAFAAAASAHAVAPKTSPPHHISHVRVYPCLPAGLHETRRSRGLGGGVPKESPTELRIYRPGEEDDPQGLSQARLQADGCACEVRARGAAEGATGYRAWQRRRICTCCCPQNSGDGSAAFVDGERGEASGWRVHLSSYCPSARRNTKSVRVDLPVLWILPALEFSRGCGW